MTDALSGKRVFLLGVARERSSALWEALSNAGALVGSGDEAGRLVAEGAGTFDACVWSLEAVVLDDEILASSSAAFVLLADDEEMHALSERPLSRCLDFARADAAPTEILARLRRMFAAEHATRHRSSAQPHVLVADDDDTTSAIVKATLELSGYRCTIARDGAQALHHLRDAAPEGVVLDIHMPFYDGFEVLRALKNSHPNTRVVLLTANASEEAMIEAFAAGADDFLVKPFRPSELAARLKRLIG